MTRPVRDEAGRGVLGVELTPEQWETARQKVGDGLFASDCSDEIVTSLFGPRPDPRPSPWAYGFGNLGQHARIDFDRANGGEDWLIAVAVNAWLTADVAELMADALREHAAWLRRNSDDDASEGVPS